MTSPTPRRSLALAAVLGLTLSGIGLGSATASPAPTAAPNSDAAAAAPGQDRTSVIVQLTGDPLSTSADVDRNGKGQANLNGKATRAERADLAQERKAFTSWLRKNAPKAKVTSTYDISLNAVAVKLNGTDIDTLRSAPSVSDVSYQQVYTPLGHEDPQLARIDAPEGWAAAGATTAESDPSTWAGFGIKVGIVDTGIDPDHPCFDDTGYPEVDQAGDTDHTNNKVIVARVFNEQAKRLGDTVEDLNGHGTHVAGTVACNLHTPANVGGADIPYDPSGVAPGAMLGNYVVFPGPDSSARTEDIVNALEAAAMDGMDVINMSLGGGYHGQQDLGTRAVDNLDRNGIVVAVAAGNDGPGSFTVGSPGSAERALTVGASSVGHYVGVPILSGEAQISVGAIGDFPVPEAPLTAPLNVVENADGTLGAACTPITEDLSGDIALISRGACTFSTKVYHAEQAGAVGVIIVNDAAGDPSAMAIDPTYPTTIPAVMAPLADKEALMALDGQEVTMGSDLAYTYTGNDDIQAQFSSSGPVRVSYRVKPDVVAPGQNILSAQPMEFCAGEAWAETEGCWAFYSGTSMATPHVAGMAAVVLDAHGDWEPWAVRSAIANTAKVDAVYNFEEITQTETDVQRVGNGLADLDAAVTAPVVLDRTTLSFGAVPGGSGQVSTLPVTVTNVSDSAQTLPVSVEAATGEFSASVDSVDLAPGESATIEVTWAPPKGSERAVAQQAHLYVGDVHLALYGYVK